jgi:acetyl-CoA C-acetyltransferase
MRPVYLIAGGVSRFAKARPDKTFPALVREALDAALADLPGFPVGQIDGSVAACFSDHLVGQAMAGLKAHEHLGLAPRPCTRVEGGGASGGLALQAAWEAVASGRMEVCLAFGFETLSRVGVRQGNELIAMAADMETDFPLGGVFTAYYALMAVRHMHEFGTTVGQLARIAVKNHHNALHNPFAHDGRRLTVEEVRRSPLLAWPLTVLDTSLMSDGAACCLLASEEVAARACPRPVRIAGIGAATDTMRLADRPQEKVPLLPHESEADYRHLPYPGVHSFRAGRLAARQAYAMAGVTDPGEELDFVELYDSYTSSELQACEDLGLCGIGKGGDFVDTGAPFLKGLDYGLDLPEAGRLPVNPSGGLLACAHPISATGLMQTVFALWQLQGRIAERFGDAALQVSGARRAAVHSHGGTGACATVTVLEGC